MLLLAVTSAVAPPSSGGGACADGGGCEYFGMCDVQTRSCRCFRGFTGPSCSLLDLEPLHDAKTRVWPRSPLAPPVPRPSSAPQLPSDFNATSWGFSVVFDEGDGLWHAMVDSACGSDGVLVSGGAANWIAHLASSEGPDRDFRLVAMATPTDSFGPHLARDPVSRNFTMVFRVNALNSSRPLCGGNGSSLTPDPLPRAFSRKAYVPPSALTADPTGESGQNFFVATAARMRGPWTARKIEITAASAAAVLGDAKIHVSNPSLIFHTRGSAAYARGRVGLAVRYNPPGGSRNAYAVADSVWGPYTAVAAGIGPHGSEDPFVFELPAGGAAGSGAAGARVLHMLWHAHSHGCHGWSTDGGVTWQTNATRGTDAFHDRASLQGGGSVAFARRERPELYFADGSVLPTHFFSGVQAAAAAAEGEGIFATCARGAAGGGPAGSNSNCSGTAFSHVQRVNI
jgi:hypothetical protein